MTPALRIVRTGDVNENAVFVARHWREAKTVYQEHASWHEASRFDARRFDGLVKVFGALRRGHSTTGLRECA